MTLLPNVTIYSEPRKLAVGYMQELKGPILAVGSICLLNHEGKAAWLHNVHVCSSKQESVVVWLSVRDGFVFVPKENGTYARMEGMGIGGCNVSERHGLYVLRVFFPLCNLWYARLV
jgi:hypothetical protein